MKRLLLSAAVLLVSGAALWARDLELRVPAAGEASMPGELNPPNSAFAPWLTLSDARSFSFATAFRGTVASSNNSAPVRARLKVQETQRNLAPATSSPEVSERLVAARKPLFDYADGELGFTYGRSSGKNGFSFEQGYIIGEVGNEHLRITAGASYERFDERRPQPRR